MSYLTTIVHPLIIIRLLQHRLFGPFTRRNNVNPTRAATAASTTTCGTNSLSILNGNQQNNLKTPTATAKSPSSNSILITSSTSFPSNSLFNPTSDQHHVLSSVSANTSKSSSPQPPLNRVNDEDLLLNNNRKLSQISTNNGLIITNVDVSGSGNLIDLNISNKLGVSPSHNSTSTQYSPSSPSKRSKLRDFSKKILRRVNSTSQNTKKTESKKLRKQNKMNQNSEHSSHFEQGKLIGS